MAVNLYNANVYKIRWNFGWVRLLGVRFEKSKILTFSSHLLNFIKQLLQIRNNYINFNCNISERNCIYNCNISLSYYPRLRRYYRHCIFFVPFKKNINQNHQIQSIYQNIRNMWRGICFEIPKFKASQCLIKTIHQIKYQFITDIWIIRTNENNKWYQ